MKRLQVGLGLFIGLSFVFVSSLWAQQQPPDNPPANQGAGQHSTIMTSNGKLRDDQLADMIKDAINNSGKTPTSVKVFFNSCYGGGMLDDIANMLKDDFEPDIPFVGASASASNEVAWGPKNSVASTTGGGSYWTDSLAGAMAGANPGDNVSGTIGTANANDPAKAGGPVGSNLPPKGKPETPQNTTANGGAAVNWGPGEGVVFSGGNNRVRHDNNVDKMEGAFLDMFGQCYSSADPANGTTKEALGTILMPACNALTGLGERCW